MFSSVRKFGFTLIELLIVISIIGILSGIVLTSLNSSRTRASDASIKENLASIRSQAAINYNGCHVAEGGSCSSVAIFSAGTCAPTADTIFSDSKIIAMITAAGNAYNGQGLSSATRCSQTVAGGAWAVAVPLKTSLAGVLGLEGLDDGQPDAWCVDSVGRSQPVEYKAFQVENLTEVIDAGDACVTS